MRCPSLVDLPPSPPSRIGWPWSADSPQLPGTMPCGLPWPRVSIVTPSYNQAPFIEETIRSVLLQGYPDLEYIIIDGGSSDSSIDIIRRYEPWLAYWVSESDRGQAHAINKGFERATGEIVAWLNSDDLYEPGVLRTISSLFHAHPDIPLIHGDITIITTDGTATGYGATSSSLNKLVNWLEDGGLAQPAVFWRRSLMNRVGSLRTDLRFIMDYEFFLRARRLFEFVHVPESLARFRVHPASKTSNLELVRAQEHMQIARENWSWIRPHASHDYWYRVRERYGCSLLTEGLQRCSEGGGMTVGMILKCVFYSPSLLSHGWVRRMIAKAILGPDLTRRLRPLIRRLQHLFEVQLGGRKQ